MALAAPLFGPTARASTAGTVISNTAKLGFDLNGTSLSTASNTVHIVIAEKLDVAVVAEPASEAIAAGAIGFRVTNAGNGSEAFDLSGATDDGQAEVRGIAIDNGDGCYDPHDDPAPTDGRLTIDAGQAALVFVVLDGEHQDVAVSLTAAAVTGSGIPGTAFDGRGDGGGDAVVGETGARATALYSAIASLKAPSLIKSQSVVAPDGSSRAVKGAVITYRLEANFPRPLAGVEIADPIPAGTGYLPGSLALDGAALSDGPDGDAGQSDGAAVKIALGEVSSGTRTITFQVKIQ